MHKSYYYFSFYLATMNNFQKYQKSLLNRSNSSRSNQTPNNSSKEKMQQPQRQPIREPAPFGISKYAKNKPNNSTNSRPSTNKPYATISSSANDSKNYRINNISTKKQYKKFLSDTDNVFYEESQQYVLLSWINFIKINMCKILMVLLLIYIPLWFIEPYGDKCPQHADCGVFVHCHAGYVLNQNGRCQVDPHLILQANNLCDLFVTTLQTQYGDYQCYLNNSDTPPHKHIGAFIQQYGISNQVLKKQINTLLYNKEFQQLKGFKFNNTDIIPTLKQYSNSCRIQLLSRQTNVRIGALLFIILIIFVAYYIKSSIQHRQAKRIYQKLKNEVLKEKTINISERRQQLIGKISEKLWSLIDSQRVKQRLIGYYQDDHLYWKEL